MTDLTHWVFTRFKSSRSGKYRMTVQGTDPNGERKITSTADARALLALLSDGPAFTEADPGPLRNCDTCAHDYAKGVRRLCAVIHKDGGPTWEWANANTNPFMGGAPQPDADNCPGYTLRLTDSAGRNTGST